ncbi:MAG: enoyl-CoA hydratase-related protein [Halapricum sp.]
MTLTVDRSDRVVICTLDDPEQRNALTARTADRLVEALEGIEETDARCVLIRGDGDTFSASGDVGAHVAFVQGELDKAGWRERLDSTADAIRAVHDCPLPTVAAVDGPAFGEGACLALACDLRIASSEASIGFGFRRFGLAAAAGATYLLPRVAGRDVALELLYTGELLGVDRAADLGLFTRVYPAASFTDDLAALLADLSTGPGDAMTTAKELVRADHDDLDVALAAEAGAQSRLADTDDFEEGVAAFAARRDPRFE